MKSMYFCLFCAIFGTLVWIDLLSVNITNAVINPYKNDMEESKRNALIRFSVGAIAALFWTAVFIFWK